MTTPAAQPALRVAIVYPGDAEVRRAATRQNNRFAALFDAFAARGVEATPAVYHDDAAGDVRASLLGCDAALVWVNPIEAGRSRARLDAMLREVASTGVVVSTHPDTIEKIGTKDVLVDTRHLGWGSDCHRVASLGQLRAELPTRLAHGAARVLKQRRGHSGIGVWRVQCVADDSAPGLDSAVRLRHAQRGSVEERSTLAAAIERMAEYFEGGGHMVDQEWQSRLAEGMLRCYLVQDRVAGFGVQAINALYPAAAGLPEEAAPAAGPRLYHPPDLMQGRALRQRLESEWLPELQRTFALARDDLPLLWDCDFILGRPDGAGRERHVLCEINVSSVAPYPESVVAPLVEATIARLRREPPAPPTPAAGPLAT